jgi:hypothetical protein
VEALESADADIHYEAVQAAGAWDVDAAWPHVVALVTATATEKLLLLAAIEAVATIHPSEAGAILVDLVDSEDEDIAEAASEAISMAEGMTDEFDEFEDDEDDEDEDDGPETIH